MPLWGM
jgi:hypothetical protein